MVRLCSVEADNRALSEEEPDGLRPESGDLEEGESLAVESIPEIDASRYVPDPEPWCKIMVNGQEPDFRGVRAVNRNGAVWGNVLCILERMKQMAPDRFTWSWDPEKGELKIVSGGNEVIARTGVTHLLVNGQENLMDGQPYVTPEGILMMEVSAVAGYVEGAHGLYDDLIGAYRITLKP